MTIRFLKKYKSSLKVVFLWLWVLLPIGGGWVVASCNDVSCPLNNTVASIYGFYASARVDGGEFVAGSAVSIQDTLTIKALGPDTVLVNRLVGKGTVNLPVSFYQDVDVLEFEFTDKQSCVGADTLWISKKNTHHFDDPSCPIHMWHTILNVRSTHHLIDTVLINNAEVNYDGLENLQIYFFTSNAADNG